MIWFWPREEVDSGTAESHPIFDILGEGCASATVHTVINPAVIRQMRIVNIECLETMATGMPQNNCCENPNFTDEMPIERGKSVTGSIRFDLPAIRARSAAGLYRNVLPQSAHVSGARPASIPESRFG
jgi:hypothetical protein